jgi:hypothetical protein
MSIDRILSGGTNLEVQPSNCGSKFIAKNFYFCQQIPKMYEQNINYKGRVHRWVDVCINVLDIAVLLE